MSDFPTDAEREAVGRAVHEHDANTSMSGVEWPTWGDLGDEGRAAYRDLSDCILDALAPHIAERVRQAAAEAWDEGAEAAWERSTAEVNASRYHWRSEGEPRNPYRAAEGDE